MTDAPGLCICLHGETQHWAITGECAISGCTKCRPHGYFPVSRGSRHRPQRGQEARRTKAGRLGKGDAILVAYEGAQLVLAAHKTDALVAYVSDRDYFEGKHLIITDIGTIAVENREAPAYIVKGRAS